MKYAENGDIQLALNCFLNIQNQNKDVYFSISGCYMGLGQVKEAEEWLLKALKNDSNSALLFILLLSFYEKFTGDQKNERQPLTCSQNNLI